MRLRLRSWSIHLADRPAVQQRRRLSAEALVVPFALAALELSHPTWSEGTVSQAVLGSGGWWIPLHVLLLVGFLAVVGLLWAAASARLARVALVAFGVCNTAFLATDGAAVGLLALSDPQAADQLWNSPLIAALANVTGAAWAASLLCVAASVARVGRSRPVLFGLTLTWLTFVASAPPIALPSIVSRLAAVATGAWTVYTTGGGGVPFALLVFAAVLPQHVGAEAALGLVLVGLALARLPQSPAKRPAAPKAPAAG